MKLTRADRGKATTLAPAGVPARHARGVTCLIRTEQRLARGPMAAWQSMQTNSPMMEGCRGVRNGSAVPPPGRARVEGEGEMTSYDPDPNLPDDVSIGQVRLPPSIKRALAAAGLKDRRRCSQDFGCNAFEYSKSRAELRQTPAK